MSSISPARSVSPQRPDLTIIPRFVPRMSASFRCRVNARRLNWIVFGLRFVSEIFRCEPGNAVTSQNGSEGL